jgi:hypothetical protein
MPQQTPIWTPPIPTETHLVRKRVIQERLGFALALWVILFVYLLLFNDLSYRSDVGVMVLGVGAGLAIGAMICHRYEQPRDVKTRVKVGQRPPGPYPPVIH